MIESIMQKIVSWFTPRRSGDIRAVMPLCDARREIFDSYRLWCEACEVFGRRPSDKEWLEWKIKTYGIES